jgi:2-keto-4-pentenoate hydratase/2-oxohepta-3-ene-1,7-dioic acid hydratase in catechol pathway
MRLATFRDPSGDVRVGAVVGERAVDLTQVIAALPLPATLAACGLIPASGMLHLLHAGADGIAAVRRHVDDAISAGVDHCPHLREIALLAPIPRPGKIIGIGRNYADHAKEINAAAPEQPRLFAKLPTSVVGPNAIVKRPAPVVKLDLEAELAVVMGAFASNVARERALGTVAGYTVLDDVSAREFQFDISPPQTTFGKSMDGFCPMGPWLVTADEIPDPQRLEIKSFLNDTQMQHGNTADMLFSVARIIEYVSRFMTLEPGDVLATGTPAGIGAFRKPPVWLKPGDRIRIEISGIGVLEHGVG